ncbi:hypothetical protein [Maricaulis sp.]|uniref:hypothetical protein n=1 Tax=Maricaulis sp. TaxID=1486257 RepID=UPI002B2760ED|nr:hypothetical protein [Maricaulis sp.]
MTTDLDLLGDDAKRIWRQFLRRLDWANRNLAAEDRAEARAEAAAHMREAMGDARAEGEAERLLAAIAEFGDPPAPPPVWRKPAAIVGHYCSIMVIGATGLVVLALLHMAVMEIFNPAGVGVWVFPDEAGFTLSYEAQQGAEEVLGAGFIPVMLALCAILGGAIYGLWRFALSPRGPVAGWMRP